MFLLGLLAIAFLPLLVQSLRVSASNATLATATQLVAQEMEELRALGSTCNSLSTYRAAVAETESERSDDLVIHISEIDCATADFPTTVTVTISVSAPGETAPIATATTLMLVER